MTTNNGKTTFREKLGYGIASMGDAVGYSLIGTFLLFFLTTVAGISPGIAGTITAVGAVWNAAINPLIGYFADKVNSKYGRRRPLIFIFSIPLMLTMILLFTDVHMPMGIKPVYYGILLMLYWTSYTGFVVPYLALGVDYTSDYDDRTVLRLFGSFFNMMGSMFAMVMPTMIVELIESFGFSTGQAWSITGIILGVITLVTNLTTVFAARHKDRLVAAAGGDKAESLWTEGNGDHAGDRFKRERKSFVRAFADIVKEYISVAMLKPMRTLIAASLTALIGYTMIMADMVYFLTYNVGMSAVNISFVMLARTVISALCIPMVGKLIALTDRRVALMGAYILGALGLYIVRFVDMPPDAMVAAYAFFLTVGTSVYWQIMPGVFYDVCEYDRITNGRNRSATIVSFQGLVEALAAGIGGQLLGIILEGAGFVGDSQHQSVCAQIWIENSTTIIPAAFFMITVAALYRYPLDKKTYNQLMESDRR